MFILTTKKNAPETTEPSSPSSGIHQLNLGYNKVQDRLLFKAGLSNNTEVQLWLSYRITKLLWQLLQADENMLTNKEMVKEKVPERAVEQFQQDVKVAKALDKMDFASEYKERKPAVEVTGSGVPLAVDAAFIQEGNNNFLDIRTDNGINMRLGLTDELALAICNMIQLTAKEAGWPIGANKQIAAASDGLDLIDNSDLLH